MNKAAEPVTDDAELAKVLEDMNSSMNAAAAGLAPNAPTDSTPNDPAASDYSTLAAGGISDASLPITPADDSASQPAAELETASPAESSEASPVLSFEETTPAETMPALTLSPLSGPMSSDSGDLESIKKDALSELRPLIDKLALPADEKFDTLLLIIRSTDDKSLIPAVHEAAKSIEDETKKAQALLDVIKEIDFFSKPQQ